MGGFLLRYPSFSVKNMKKIGRIGKANIESRKRIAEIAEDRNIVTCEIQLPGCRGTFGLAPCHKHPRNWYKGDVDKLADPNQWIGGCQYCHEQIDTNKKLKEETFKRLRP